MSCRCPESSDHSSRCCHSHWGPDPAPAPLTPRLPLTVISGRKTARSRTSWSTPCTQAKAVWTARSSYRTHSNSVCFLSPARPLGPHVPQPQLRAATQPRSELSYLHPVPLSPHGLTPVATKPWTQTRCLVPWQLLCTMRQQRRES